MLKKITVKLERLHDKYDRWKFLPSVTTELISGPYILSALFDKIFDLVSKQPYNHIVMTLTVKDFDKSTNKSPKPKKTKK